MYTYIFLAVKYAFGLAYVEAIGKMYAFGGNSMQVYVYNSLSTAWTTSCKFKE
jgi:hypothetical protein